jgi:hypothetical protein
MELTFENYTESLKTATRFEVKTIHDVVFTYDGGRLSVWVNGEKVFETFYAGNDFSVQVTK